MPNSDDEKAPARPSSPSIKPMDDSTAMSEESNAAPQAKPVVTPSIPNGGLQAWLTVLGAFLIQVCGFGYTTSFGVYQDFYVRHYITDATPSAISWIGSMNAFLIISGGVIAGRLYDRGYFYALLWGGSFLTAFGLFMLSLAKPNHYYQVFLAQGVAMGLGGGLSYVPSAAIITHYFTTKRALAMTIVASGSSFGAVIHPIMLNNLFNSKLGFGNSVRASAGLVTGLLLVACLILRTRIPVQPPKGKGFIVLKKLYRDSAYVAATLGLMILTIGFYFPQFYIQLDAIDHGLDETFSFYSLVVLNVAGIAGRVIPGFYATKLGIGNVLTFAAFADTAIIFAMIGLKSVASVVLIALFYGFFSGTFVGFITPLIALLTDDMSELGVRLGVALFFTGLGALIGTPIGGALLTDKLIWWRLAVFSGVMSGTGSTLFALMLVLQSRRKRTSGEAGTKVSNKA